jgi:ribonuclease HII
MENSLFDSENKLREKFQVVAGVDEAGRGPLAGPVVAAAVILKPTFYSNLIDDSKKLSPLKREKAFFLIKKNCIDFAVTAVSYKRIDDINILNAALEAMRMSIYRLKIKPDVVLIDGNKAPGSGLLEMPIVGGDKKYFSIAAASIIAKYIRDKIMENYSKLYPEYNFQKHKGYPTKEHRELIKKYGPCKIHRKSFKLLD